MLNEAINQVDKAFTVLEEYRQSDTATEAGLKQLTESYRQAVDNLKQTYRNTRGSNVGGGLRLSDMIMGYYTGSDPYSSTGSSRADAAMDALNLHPRVEQPSRTNTGEPTLFDNEEVKPNAEPEVDELERKLREGFERENSPEYKAKQDAETKARIQQQKELNEFLKESKEFLTEEEFREMQKRMGKPGYFEWVRNLQKTVKARVPSTSWGRLAEFFKKAPKKLKNVK